MPERPPGRQRATSADPDEERVRLRAEIKSLRARIREAVVELEIVRAREKSLCDLLESYENQVRLRENEISNIGVTE